MPAAKSMRVQSRRAERNRAVKSLTRSRVTAARHAVDEAPNADDTAEKIRMAMSALDVAKRKGVIHPNQAARKKSRLAKRLNKAQTAAA